MASIATRIATRSSLLTRSLLTASRVKPIPFSAIQVPFPELQHVRFKSKAKKGKGGNKKPPGGKSAVDDFIDDLTDDEDFGDLDDEERRVAKANKTTPASKFVDNFKPAKKNLPRISYEDVLPIVNVDAYWKDLEKVAEDLRTHFAQHLNMRTSQNAFDELKVDLDGDEFPLREVAQLHKANPKRIIIDVSAFPEAANAVLKAIRDSGMNLNPQRDDATRISVEVPKVTRESREQLAAGAKAKFESAKDALRKLNSDYLRRFKEEEGSKDEVTAAKGVLLAMMNHFVEDAEQILAQKRKELTGK